MEQKSATSAGLVSSNHDFTKQDPEVEMCYVCTMYQKTRHVGFDAPRLSAGAVSKQDAASNQIPVIAKQEIAWAYPSSLFSKDRNHSYSPAGLKCKGTNLNHHYNSPPNSGLLYSVKHLDPAKHHETCRNSPVQILSDSNMISHMSHVGSYM